MWIRGCVNQSDWMASSYSISWHTFKWMKKLFFPLLDHTIPTQLDFVILYVGLKFSYWGFGLRLVKNLIKVAGKCLSHSFSSIMVGKPSLAVTSVTKSSSESPNAGQLKETKSTVECAALMEWDMPLVTGEVWLYGISFREHQPIMNL